MHGLKQENIQVNRKMLSELVRQGCNNRRH